MATHKVLGQIDTLGKIKLDKLTPARRSENMRRIRSTNTAPELAVRRLVYGMGYRYRLHVANLAGKPDIVLTRLGKIIEVRGCFWHQHERCIDSHIPKTRASYWRPKLSGNKRRDRSNERALRTAGWEVLVVWACEVENLMLLEKKLAKFLRSDYSRIRGNRHQSTRSMVTPQVRPPKT